MVIPGNESFSSPTLNNDRTLFRMDPVFQTSKVDGRVVVVRGVTGHLETKGLFIFKLSSQYFSSLIPYILTNVCVTSLGFTMTGSPSRLNRCTLSSSQDGVRSCPTYKDYIPIFFLNLVPGEGENRFTSVGCVRTQIDPLGEHLRVLTPNLMNYLVPSSERETTKVLMRLTFLRSFVPHCNSIKVSPVRRILLG